MFWKCTETRWPPWIQDGRHQPQYGNHGTWRDGGNWCDRSAWIRTDVARADFVFRFRTARGGLQRLLELLVRAIVGRLLHGRIWNHRSRKSGTNFFRFSSCWRESKEIIPLKKCHSCRFYSIVFYTILWYRQYYIDDSIKWQNSSRRLIRPPWGRHLLV